MYAGATVAARRPAALSLRWLPPGLSKAPRRRGMRQTFPCPVKLVGKRTFPSWAPHRAVSAPFSSRRPKRWVWVSAGSAGGIFPISQVRPPGGPQWSAHPSREPVETVVVDVPGSGVGVDGEGAQDHERSAGAVQGVDLAGVPDVGDPPTSGPAGQLPVGAVVGLGAGAARRVGGVELLQVFEDLVHPGFNSPIRMEVLRMGLDRWAGFPWVCCMSVLRPHMRHWR